MKIYTRSGDQGDTGLFGGPRVPKDHPRIEAYGTVDELGTVLGQARSQSVDAELAGVMLHVQHRLFDLGAELATPEPARKGVPRVTEAMVRELEEWIDRFQAQLPALNQFILAGGTPVACSLQLARAICRRAERRVVSLAGASDGGEAIGATVIIYLNRLSDLLFVLGRLANARAGTPDVVWQKFPREG
jgi:cob(I)alamin adenosyltransferase